MSCNTCRNSWGQVLNDDDLQNLLKLVNISDSRDLILIDKQTDMPQTGVRNQVVFNTKTGELYKWNDNFPQKWELATTLAIGVASGVAADNSWRNVPFRIEGDHITFDTPIRMENNKRITMEIRLDNTWLAGRTSEEAVQMTFVGIPSLQKNVFNEYERLEEGVVAAVAVHRNNDFLDKLTLDIEYNVPYEWKTQRANDWITEVLYKVEEVK